MRFSAFWAVFLTTLTSSHPADFQRLRMEAEEGIEPSHDGFANHCLTIWLLRRARGAGASDYLLAGRVSMPGFRENVASRAAKA